MSNMYFQGRRPVVPSTATAQTTCICPVLRLMQIGGDVEALSKIRTWTTSRRVNAGCKNITGSYEIAAMIQN